MCSLLRLHKFNLSVLYFLLLLLFFFLRDRLSKLSWFLEMKSPFSHGGSDPDPRVHDTGTDGSSRHWRVRASQKSSSLGV